MSWESAQQILTLLGVLITAAATFALWRATSVLAVETKRLAEASSQPQIVVSIENNQWSFIHADLRVANTGNSTAFDVKIQFDPPLEIELETGTEPVETPLQNISLLKPGQEMASWVGKMYSFLDSVFQISISYARAPGGVEETISYTLDMSSYRSMHRLGSGDPLIQISNDIKKIRADVRKTVGGSNKLGVDIFTSSDREAREQQLRELRETRHADPDDQKPQGTDEA